MAEFLMNPFEVLLPITVLIVVYLLGKVIRKKNSNLPPGPVGLPIVGYYPFLTKYSHLKFTELSKKYGNVLSLYLGSKYVVVLNDANSVREAFTKKEFLERPPNSPFALFGLETPFFTHNFPMWVEQRKFIFQTMKELGLGSSKMEANIQDEIKYFLGALEETGGKPTNLMKPLTPSISNNICALVFGERYAYDDPNWPMLDSVLEHVGKAIAQTQPHIFVPWLKYIPYLTKLLNYENAMTACGKMKDFIEKQIADHKKNLDSKNVRDYIDSYIVEQRSREENKVQTTLSHEPLKGSCLQLFGAGSEPLRISMNWCLYIMGVFPDVQKKIQDEIQEQLGSKSPEYSDQKNMPYTQAVIREMMRWKTVVPLNVLRYTSVETKISGYRIPKGTIIIANYWAVHHDPKVWKDPDTFIPERFLDESGNVKRNNNFMPFSVGKRACPGESMAVMEIFLYFVSILQKFTVRFPPNFNPSFEADLGISLRLKPHELCFLPR